ncbi:glycosyltransferase family 32 protein [Bipolaris oryzae ATCC 44560]|uniref:Glycosyltransferase family 32 protein n=1 Tax=Bipolaris oryzae ATCC 44560 TaxID=930090 RepID=W6ZX11_COCMI|nr:glycosyltransferase family 32 protein [Bipolaris oryzae ATCC 44560]EUC48371.1 glycosyltransferase family 32 protein [Bipolaris oryzae ATCC 44560]
MLTFKKALVLSLACLTLFFIFKSQHHGSTTPKYRNAHDMPRPTAWVNPADREREKQKANKQKEAQKHADAPAKADQSDKSFDVPDTPSKKPKTQVSLDELRKKPLTEQLEYQFPYDVDTKTPAYIWQTWKHTPQSGEFEEIFREPEASWTIHHPSFVHEVITDDVALHLIRHLYASVPEVVEAYNAMPAPVLKADFFRYLILLARGGIYSDIDTTALKPAFEWIPSDVAANSYGMVIGIEADPDRPDWADWYSRRIQFCQWTIQSKPGHPVLVDVVARITEETLNRKRAGKLTANHKDIVEFTGPAVWTDTIFSYFNNPDFFDMSTSKGNITWENFTGMKAPKKVGDVIVLPITSFSPGIKTMGAGEDDDPMAFVKHSFEGTWKPQHLRHIGEIFN